MRRVTFSYTNWKSKSIHFEISLYLQKSEPEKSYDPSKYHINKVLFTIYKIIAQNNFFVILNVLLLMYHCWGFPSGSEGKASACNEGGPGFHPWVKKIPWRRKWQPTPVFLPGESHGQRSLASYSPWGHKESNTTEWLEHTCK